MAAGDFCICPSALVSGTALEHVAESRCRAAPVRRQKVSDRAPCRRRREASDRGPLPASGAPRSRAYTSPRLVTVGHSQRLAQPLTRGQQRVIAVLVAVALAAATWAVLRPSSAPVSHNGCVSVVVASSTGGGLLHTCGAAARAWCQTEFARTDALA